MVYWVAICLFAYAWLLKNKKENSGVGGRRIESDGGR